MEILRQVENTSGFADRQFRAIVVRVQSGCIVMAHSYEIKLAAKMAEASYAGRNHASLAPALRKELDED